MEQIYGDCGHLIEWGDDVLVILQDESVGIICDGCEEMYADMCNCSIADIEEDIIWRGKAHDVPEKYLSNRN